MGVCNLALVIQPANHIFSGPYNIVICGLSGSTIFSTLLHKQHNFQKECMEHKMCVLIFTKNFNWNISQPKKNSARYYHKCIQVFKYSTHYSCQILVKLEFPWQIFKKSSNIKSDESPFSGSRVVACRQADMMKLTVTFYNCEFAIVQTCLKMKFINKILTWF